MIYARLLLAHLSGDYLLQPDWMVQRKSEPWALPVHGLIHFLSMVVLIAPRQLALWPPLASIALLHLLLDRFKLVQSSRVSGRAVTFYLLDQAIHLLILAGGALWLAQAGTAALLPPPQPWLPPALGLLLVTSVWAITERVLAEAGVGFFAGLPSNGWIRAVTRAVIVLAVVGVGRPSPFFAAAGLWPYALRGKGLRAIGVDVAVSLVAALLVLSLG